MRTSSRITGALALLALALGALVAPGPALGAAGTQSDLIAVVGQGAGRVIVSSTAEDQGTFAVQIEVALHAARPGTTCIAARRASRGCSSRSSSGRSAATAPCRRACA